MTSNINVIEKDPNEWYEQLESNKNSLINVVGRITSHLDGKNINNELSEQFYFFYNNVNSSSLSDDSLLNNIIIHSERISQLLKDSPYINELKEEAKEIDETIKACIESSKRTVVFSTSEILNGQHSNKKKNAKESTKEMKELIRTEFDDSLQKLRKDLNTTRDEVEAEFNSKIKVLIEEKNNQIKEEASVFENLNKELSLQLGLIGNETLSNRNISQANKEEKTANSLRALGTMWLATLSIYAGIMFEQMITNTEVPLDFKLLLIRWLIIFLLTMPGVYLLKESSRHRSDERKYRQLGVQLATINSYLESFDEVDKNKIKQELTSNFFGYEQVKADSSSVPDLQKSFDKAFDALVSIAKRNKP